MNDEMEMGPWRTRLRFGPYHTAEFEIDILSEFVLKVALHASREPIVTVEIDEQNTQRYPRVDGQNINQKEEVFRLGLGVSIDAN